MKKYSEQIYKIRKAEGLSQEEFGNKIGVSRQMVSKWEIGESSPRTDKINKICTTFGITPAEFISDDEEDKESKKITKIIFKNKKEKLVKSQQQRKKIIKHISILVISVISTIYIICSLCKFIYLKSLNKEMLKFKELNNYYFVLTSYMGSKAVDTKEVWYLDGKYKIEETYNSYENHVSKKKYTYYIDALNNTEKKYSQNNSEIKMLNDKTNIDNQFYNNGSFLYYCFPKILNNDKEEITKVSLSLGLIRVHKLKNDIILINKKQEIIFNESTGIPIKIINKGNGNNNKVLPTMQFIEIQFDCVSDNDVTDQYEK